MKESQIEQMLKIAAAKLNMSPEQLKSAASSGDVNSILSKLDKKSAQKVQSVMSDKKVTDELLKRFGNNNSKN